MTGAPDAWSEWQRDHAAALAALQEAQRTYHRDTIQSAFGGPPSREALRRGLAEAPSDHDPAEASRQSALERRKSALEALEEARIRLDRVRARMPRH